METTRYSYIGGNASTPVELKMTDNTQQKLADSFSEGGFSTVAGPIR